MSSKGKAIDDGKGKRKIDDSDKTVRRIKKRSGVLQFFEDSAHEADDSESSLDSIFGDDDDFLEDLLDTETNIHPEPYKSVTMPVQPKEEEMTEEEHEKMLEKLVQERYRPGSSFVTYAEDRRDPQRSITRGSVTSVDPVIWKTKCMVGRERHSAFCLMQKYVDNQSLGKKLQIVSAFVVEHVKGALFIEAYKRNDIYEACNGIPTIYPSRVAAVKTGEITNLLTVRSRQSTVNVGTFARVKRGIYKGDLAQVVAVNDLRRKATVKLIPRVDLQALAAKFGGGEATKRTDTPAPRLICSSELEELRPLIHSRRDRDSNISYEVLDGMLLKDGYLYKKVPFDSLTLYGIQPTEDELLKFESRSDESNDVEWLSELYGEQEKSCTKKSDKGGGKGVGPSSSNLENGFEVHDMVFFSRSGFGVIIGTEKDDSFKVLKEGTEGQQIVNVKRRDLKKASFDNKFTAWDRHKKIISINDSVRILEGQLEGRHGVVKQIYRGTVFLYDDAEQENSGYLCCKAQNCEKFKLFGDVCKEKGNGQAPLGFDDFSSSPKSPLSPKKPWQERDINQNQGEKDEIFSVGQSLRIRIGPLKGYICRVLALRRSDVTVKLDSQHKILTVKAEHLVPVQSSVPTSDALESKPFDLLGTQEGGSGEWADGAAGTSTDAQGWGAGGQTTESNSWNAFPSSSFSLNPEAETLDPPNSMDIDSSKDDGGSGWVTKSAPTQDSSWGVAATDEAALASAEQVGGWGKSDGVGGSSNSDSSWGKAKVSSDDQPGSSNGAWGAAKNNNDAGWGISEVSMVNENNVNDNTTSGWGSANVKSQNESWGAVADKETGGWGNGSGRDFDGNGGGGRSGGRGGGRGGFAGRGGASGSSCYKCGETGHMARECTQGGGNGGNACYKCGESGHMARECSQGGGGGGNACYKCGENGHMARECTQGGSGGGGGSRGANTCYKCGETGHMARECTQGGSRGGNACYKCGETGHMARDCSQGGGGSGNACYKCGETGHMARDCSQGGGGRGNSCYKCGETGHMARECNQGGGGGGGGGADSNGLTSWSNSNKDAGVTSWSTKVAANQNSSWGAAPPQNEIGGWSSKAVQTSSDTPVTETGGWGNAWNKTSDASKDAGSSWGAAAPTEREKNNEGSSWGVAAPDKEIGGWSNQALQNESNNTPVTETGGWSSSRNKTTADTSKDAGSSWGTAVPEKEKESGGWSSKEGWNISTGIPDKETGGWDGAGKFSGHSGGRGGGASGNACYKCGESGHMARECSQGGSKGGNACYKCGESGHMARECTQGGSRGGNACYKCGESGHMARECPQGGSRGGSSCYKCGETGHISRDCSQGGGSGRNSCYKCGEAGHMSRECSKPGGSGNNCFKCGESGHRARDCTQGGGGGGGGYGTNSWSATNLSSQPECNIADRVNSMDNDSWKKDASSGWVNKMAPNDNSLWGAAKSDEKLVTSTNTWGNKWNNNEGSSSKEITSEKVTTGWGSTAEPCASIKDGNANKDDGWKESNVSSEKGTGGWGGAGGSWG